MLAFGWLSRLVVFAVMSGAPVKEPASGKTPRAGEADDRAIAVKDVAAVREVLVRHEGAYWTIGPVVRDVRTYMRSHGQRGPLFVRYFDDPVTYSGRGLRSEIGFVVDGEHAAEAPLVLVERPGERVVFRVTADRALSLRRDYTALTGWAKDRGLAVTGTLTEVYHSGASSGPRRAENLVSGDDPARVEVRLTVRRSPVQRKKEPVADTPPSVWERAGAGGAPVPSSEARESKPVVSAEPQTREGVEALVEAEADGDGVEPTEDSPKTVGGERERHLERSICELLGMGEVELIVGRLMPEGREIPIEDQAWFGQVVLRIRTGVRGLVQMYPVEGGAETALGDAIDVRYREVAGEFTVDPLRDAVVDARGRSGLELVRRRRLLTELDGLLGTIAVRGAERAEVRNRLCGVVEGLIRLLARDEDRRVPDGDK